MGREGSWVEVDKPAVVETESVGIFTDINGKLAEKWKVKTIEKQQEIADAITKITGDGPAICSLITDDQDVWLFDSHMTNYLSVEGEDKNGLKKDAADGIRRLIKKVEEA